MIGEEKQISRTNARFELLSICLNHAIWLLGYAEFTITHLDGGSEQEERKRKLAYDSLLKAAGLLVTLVGEIASANLVSSQDLSQNFLEALCQQALAQAQEITVSRACWKRNSPSLIASLAHDTAQKYFEASESLRALETSPSQRVTGFRSYCAAKHQLYTAIAYYYLSLHQSALHEGGPAVASANAAGACLLGLHLLSCLTHSKQLNFLPL